MFSSAELLMNAVEESISSGAFRKIDILRSSEMSASQLDNYLSRRNVPGLEAADRLAAAIGQSMATILAGQKAPPVIVHPTITEELRREILGAARIAAEETIRLTKPEIQQAHNKVTELEATVQEQHRELIKLRMASLKTQSTLSPVRLDFTNLIAASPLDDSQLEDLLDAIREPLLGELHEPKQKKRTR